jgi:peptide chain release factor 1
MSLDPFVCDKLDSIQRNFEALTERLADPDISSNRQQVMSLSKERAASERTVEEYQQWKELQRELEELVLMEQSQASDQELREMAREEARSIIQRQEEIERKIMVLLLPTDPNDDRNVMLEVRSGA